MKSLQKRYFYAAGLGALGFLVSYLIIDLGLIFSIFLTILIYIAGIFIFKEKDIREYDADDINKYYFQTSKILSYKNRIKDKEMIETVGSISDISSKILSALTQKPKKVTQVYNFYDYYMSLVLKLLERYAYLEKKKDKTDNENKFLEKCETYLINIENEFKKQLDNMYKTSELDIEKEIKLFESICTIEGLDKESGVDNA